MWKVFLNEFMGKKNTYVLLSDAKSLLGGYLVVKKDFFNDLYARVTGQKHYSSDYQISKVIGLDKADWTNNSWYLIIAKKTDDLDFWLLLKQEPDATGRLVGIGPNDFVEFFEETDNNIIEDYLVSIVLHPKKWKNVIVFVN
ncbi:MAG: hypothetical protein ACTSQY_05960 [Candidatus Odinarchaeia archaeon]